jgi:hypothetical protein
VPKLTPHTVKVYPGNQYAALHARRCNAQNNRAPG